MEIEKIIYQTTREINNVEDKLRIVTIFLFCDKIGSFKLAELLYCEDKEQFINELQKEYEHYDVDFYINFSNFNIKRAFDKTIVDVIKKEDVNGYLKALYDKDPFALVIQEVVNYNFDYTKILKLKDRIKEVQLSLFG